MIAMDSNLVRDSPRQGLLPAVDVSIHLALVDRVVKNIKVRWATVWWADVDEMRSVAIARLVEKPTLDGALARTIARGAVLDWLDREATQRQGRNKDSADDVEGNPPLGRIASLDDSRLELADFWSAAATLPEDYQAVLRSRFAHGATNREIAAQRGVSEGAVKQVVNRAGKELRRIVETPTWTKDKTQSMELSTRRPWSIGVAPDSFLSCCDEEIEVLQRVLASAQIACCEHHPLHGTYKADAAKSRIKNRSNKPYTPLWDTAECAKTASNARWSKPENCSTDTQSQSSIVRVSTQNDLSNTHCSKSEAPTVPHGDLPDSLAAAVRAGDIATYRAARLSLTKVIVGAEGFYGQ